MQKILILANDDIGLYKFRKELIGELVKNYEVYLSLPEGDYVSEFKKLGCKFINTPMNRRGTNPIKDLKLLARYKKIIKDVKPKAVLTYTIKPNVYGGLVCSMYKVPYIANITGLGTAVEFESLLQKITLFLYRISMRKSACIFFQNKENKIFFESKKVIGGNHRLIPGSGVNLNYFSYIDYSPDDRTQFLFIGRVMKEKGIDQYIDAAKYIRQKYPDTVFHILGYCEEDYENKLKELQNKGIIKYHGMQNNIREFLTISHCTIHPTYYPEGMSNVLLESAASGRPIITTNRSGCREIIDDGINGFIVEPKNSNDLIQKIERFLTLDHKAKKNMGLAGRKKVEKEFDRKIVIDAYLEEIGKALNLG
jgi:glycosyltransferase involved in cell wall biosynthesis